MRDFSHLNAIENRIFNESTRLTFAKQMLASKTSKRDIEKWENEKAFREREIESAKKELKAERKLLGFPEVEAIMPEMSLDDIFKELDI